MRAQRGRLGTLAACLLLSGFFCGMVLHAAHYLAHDVRPHLERIFPRDRLLVRPATADLLFLRLDTGAITAERAERVGELEGVVAVHPQLAAQFPVSAEIPLPGLEEGFVTELVLHGIPSTLVGDDLPGGARFEWDADEGEPVPVVVSAYFLDLYNMGMAEASRLPKLSPSAVIGREFQLVLGESVVTYDRVPGARRQRARVVGLAHDPALMGVSVPIEALRSWNRELASDRRSVYSLLHVDLEEGADPDAALEAIRGVGLRGETRAESMGPLRRALDTVQWLFAGLVGATVLLAAVGILATLSLLARERRARIGVMRATGLPRGALALLLGTELLVVALVASVVAMALTAGCVTFLAQAVEGAGLEIAALPGDPFRVRWEVGVMIFGGAAALLLVPGFWMLRRALFGEPAALVTQRDL